MLQQAPDRICSPVERGAHPDRTCDLVGDLHWSRLILKDCTLWKGHMVGKFIKNFCPWEGLTLQKFVEDCLPWEEPLARGGKECEESLP